MQRVTYYFGAGASANALPMYSDFATRLQVYHDFLFHYFDENPKNKIDNSKKYLACLLKIIEDLNNWENATVDTYAQLLYNRPDSTMEFIRYKRIISDYFLFEQLRKNSQHLRTMQRIGNPMGAGYHSYDGEIASKVNTRIDSRYGAFVNSIAGNPAKVFPSHINFISWNYDLQFELSHANMLQCSIDTSQLDLQIYPAPGVNYIDPERSAIIKLNGSAGIYNSKSENRPLLNYILKNADDNFERIIDDIVTSFIRNHDRIFDSEPFMSFSFEKDNRYREKAIEYAQSIIRKTEVLVIVGYQFHSNNREVDRKVLSEAGSLKKAYIQVPKTGNNGNSDEFERVKNNFMNTFPRSRDIEIYHHHWVDNYLTPNDVWA